MPIGPLDWTDLYTYHPPPISLAESTWVYSLAAATRNLSKKTDEAARCISDASPAVSRENPLACWSASQ